MTYDDAVKRWIASTSGLPFERIREVNFEVEPTADSRTLDPHMQLEIDVHMTDGTQHLFTRGVRDFGKIVNEVLDQAS
jgi:hypothetical protein